MDLKPNITPVQFLKIMNLRQEPPRVRTVLFTGGQPVRLAFPWVSIGVIRYRELGGYQHKHAGLRVWFHNKKWETLNEASGILRIIPDVFNTGSAGNICIGDAEPLLARRKITPSEAFWMTDTTAGHPDWLPDKMRDILHPENVLTVNWSNRQPIPWKTYIQQWQSYELYEVEGWPKKKSGFDTWWERWIGPLT